MSRSIQAVVGAYLTFGLSAVLLFAVSGQDPHLMPCAGFLVFSVLYGVGSATLSGYLAAAVARRLEVVHASALAGIMAFFAVVSLVIEAGKSSIWSPLATLFFMVPAAVLGGYLRRWSVARGRSKGSEV